MRGEEMYGRRRVERRGEDKRGKRSEESRERASMVDRRK